MRKTSKALTEIAQGAYELMKAETAALGIAESERTEVYYAAVVGKYEDIMLKRRVAAVSINMCSIAFEKRIPVLVQQAEGDKRILQHLVKSLEIKTALAAPVIYEDRVLGTFLLLNRIDGVAYDAEAEQTLVDYAQKVAPLVWDHIDELYDY